MRRLIVVVVFLIAAGSAVSLNAGDSEQLRFAGGLLARKWYDWAGEVAGNLIEKADTDPRVRRRAAVLHVEILRTEAAATGNEALQGEADRLEKTYREMGLIEKGGILTLELLRLRLGQAENLAQKAQIEPNDEKRAALKSKAVEIFEKAGGEFKSFIEKARLAVAEYPPEHKWRAWMKKATAGQREEFLNIIWKRDYAEYLYANSFVTYGKVVAKEKKIEVVKQGLRKFMRFIDGEKEHANDFDPPAKGEKGPHDPNPRHVFRMLEYAAGIGYGQCYLELGSYEKAIEYFDYMVQAEIPFGSEKSQTDIGRVVNTRLQAYYLEGYAYNLSGRPRLAEKVLSEMFKQSKKEIQPDRPGILEYWKKQNQAEVALMPDIRENVFGKLASFQLARALAAQGRAAEGMEEVFRIFRIERKERKSGKETPFEIEAAKTMAELIEKTGETGLPVGMAFAVARGFYCREKWEQSIYYYKKVYGADGTTEEINEYVPEALFELGKLLYERKRYLEAGIAFGQICREFPEFQMSAIAAKLLRQSCRNVREAAKKAGALTDFEDEILEMSKKLPGESTGLLVPQDTFREACELIGKKDYKGAIELFSGIPENFVETRGDGSEVTKPIPFFAYVLAQTGRCRYLIAVQKKGTSEKEAQEEIGKAVEVLEKALEKAPALQDSKAQVTAHYYLAKCFLEDVWKGGEVKASTRKSIKHLKVIREKFKDSGFAKKFMPEVLAASAMAYYKLDNYDNMHAAFKELEKGFKDNRVLRSTSLTLYELMKKRADKAAAKNEKTAGSCYEKAAYYVHTLYRAAGDTLSQKELLWVGNALYETKSFKEAIEVLEKFLAVLPGMKEQSKEQKEQAVCAKVLLAQARYESGDYKNAARIFDKLRRTVACPKCGYTGLLEWKNFDKPLERCPVCGRPEVRLEKVNDTLLPIQEGAAKSHLAIYEKLGMKDTKALNKAQDIYQRMHKRLDAGKNPDKYWEVTYIILRIWRYKGEFEQIVGQIRNILLFSNDDWKKAIPIQPWRDRIKKLYYASLKALKKDK